jgi:hypothetical protein
MNYIFSVIFEVTKRFFKPDVAKQRDVKGNEGVGPKMVTFKSDKNIFLSFVVKYIFSVSNKETKLPNIKS